MTTNYGGGASSNEADDGVCRLRESDAIESLKGVNIKNFRLRNSTTKKSELHRYTHISTVDVCLLLLPVCCLMFVCLLHSLTRGPGQAGWCVRRCRVNFWLPLFVFKGTTAALHWRWRGLWCLAVRERGWAVETCHKRKSFFFRTSRSTPCITWFISDISFFRFHFSRWRRENDDWNARFRINERIYWDEAKVMINTPARSGTASLHYSSLNELCPT